MLDLSELNAFYDESHVLHQLNLRLEDGERVSVLGRNGAGKSTLLKSIMGAGPRTAGRLTWAGQNIIGQDTADRARSGLTLVPEDRRIFPHLTSRENVELAARGRGQRIDEQDVDRLFRAFPMLVPLADQLGGTLSGGQQQMLAIVRALVVKPRLLLLDEPTEGLAPVIVQELAKAISEICRTSDMGLLICEQNIWFARQCTDRVCLIDSGHIVFSGEWADFDKHDDLKMKYLVI